MSASNDGGNAFPLPIGTCNRAVPSESGGMSLRDYFAAKAMQGAFTSPIAASQDEKDYIAKHAYAMADAMLAAREAS